MRDPNGGFPSSVQSRGRSFRNRYPNRGVEASTDSPRCKGDTTCSRRRVEQHHALDRVSRLGRASPCRTDGFPGNGGRPPRTIIPPCRQRPDLLPCFANRRAGERSSRAFARRAASLPANRLEVQTAVDGGPRLGKTNVNELVTRLGLMLYLVGDSGAGPYIMGLARSTPESIDADRRLSHRPPSR